MAILGCGLASASGSECSLVSRLESLLGSDDGEAVLLREAREEKMVPEVCDVLGRCGYIVPSTFQVLAEIQKLRSAALYRSGAEVVDVLLAAEVPIMALKGAAIADEKFNRPCRAARHMSDIDVMIRPPDAFAVTAAFRQCGFQQGRVVMSTMSITTAPESEVLQFMQRGHELYPFSIFTKVPELSEYAEPIRRNNVHRMRVVDMDVYFCCSYDVHLGLGARFDIEDCWYGDDVVVLPSGQAVRRQCDTDMIWFHAIKCYQDVVNGSRGIRLFTDVVRVICCESNCIDWQRIMTIADRYDLHAPMYYILWHVNDLCGVGTVPCDVVSRCYAKKREKNVSDDFGDVMRRMIGCTDAQSILSL
jgi:hypothetical protein